ncbi:MAG: peptidylprolyl isomerase [candidate division FCPU426 bacterium]
MKRTLLITAAVLGGALLFSLGYLVKYFSGQWHAPRVLVTVNGQDILESELKREMRFLQVSEGVAFSSITREDVLDRMINDRLIMDEARRLKISISETSVDGFIAKFWEGYAPEEVNRLLSLQQLKPSDLQDLMHTRLLVEATIKQAVEDPIHIGEDEIEAYYWTHLLQFYRQDRVHARQIVVETKAQAEAILQQLAAGEAFADLAKRFSRGPEKDQGGDLGWVEKDGLPQSFSRVLFSQKTGQVSQPVATPYGYHLFLVDEKQTGGKIPLTEAKEMIAEDLKLQKIEKAFQAWLENLRAQATIVIHARRGAE